MTISPAVSRVLVAIVFTITGTLHFVIPAIYLDMMPPYLPWHEQLVFLSGVFEILGGIAVLIPPLRRAACWGLIALLVAVFPANVQYTLNAYHETGWSLRTILSIARWPIQPLLILWVWTACRKP